MVYKIKKYIPPFPTSAEILRSIAKHLGTKIKKCDDYVRKGTHDERIHRELFINTVLSPIEDCSSSYKLRVRIENCYNLIHKQYHEVVANQEAGELTRSKISPHLYELFSIFAIYSIKFITKQISRPKLKDWIKEERLLPYTINWLNKNNYTFREGINYIPNRSSRYHLTRYKSIHKFINEIQEYFPNFRSNDIEEISINLIIACTIDSYIEEYGDALLKTIQYNVDFYDGYIFKSWSSQQNNHSVFTQNLLEYEDIPATLIYKYYWHIARSSTNSNHKKTALEYYKKAFLYSLYTAGKDQLRIIHEALAVAASYGKKGRSFFKQLKNQAIAFDIFYHFPVDQPDPQIGNKVSRCEGFVEDWELEQWADAFQYLFPQSSWPIKKYPPGIFVDVGSLKLDLRHPDREIQISFGKPKKMPQLVWFTQLGETNAVKSLLKAGANISQLSKAGKSALLMAIQKNNPTIMPFKPDESSLFNLLYEHATKTRNLDNKRCSIKIMCNTPTVKRKLTLLGCAIETGQTSIVQKILRLGANIHQRLGIDQITPLQHCIGLLAKKKNYNNLGKNITNYASEMPHSIRHETNRRYSNFPFQHIENSKMNEYMPQVLDCYIEGFKQLDYDQLVMIAVILLENGASPNSKNDNGLVSNFTPLMSVIEIDDIELFQLMTSKYKGDTNRSCYSYRNNEFYTCKDIAWRWGSHKILKEMGCTSK